MPASRIRDQEKTLSADELGRAERFRFQKDRQRYIVAHGLLRTILSGYLDTEPGELRFLHNLYGKPSLIPTPGQIALRFNMSHSDGLALYAVARDREIGVDLERVYPIGEAESIAERFFSPREKVVFRALRSSQKQEAFFTCWTCKEAYVKARGEGLGLPLNQFSVSLDPAEPAELLNVTGDPREPARWSLRRLAPGFGYVAALAVEGHDWRILRWQAPA